VIEFNFQITGDNKTNGGNCTHYRINIHTRVNRYLILLWATHCKYIRLQPLCQVKIEVKKIQFLKAKKHLTRKTLFIMQSTLFLYLYQQASPSDTQVEAD
jgi:hypothetical protein